MILYSPGEVAFSINGFCIYWYGIILACAIFVGYLTVERISIDSSIPNNFWIENTPILILSGILGARLYYCAINYQYYSCHILEIFDIRQGGLSVHGAIIMGIIILLTLSKINNINFWKLSDYICCALPLSQSIGRWGNFFNNEAFGIPTNGNWGLYIPIQNRPAEYMQNDLFHPTFLYESICDFIIFCITIYLIKKNIKSGYITLLYLILYSATRIVVEYLRTDSLLNIYNIPIAQIVSVIIIITSMSFIALIHKRDN